MRQRHSSPALNARAAQEPAKPAEASAQDLAKQAQNPIADLISVPFQNDTNFNYGPRERTQNILNFQPVVPFKLSEDWNLITRTIVPIVHQPSLAKGDTSDNGLGDVNPTLFFATSVAKDLMVGFGPTFTLPTSSQDLLGARKWSAGPAAVASGRRASGWWAGWSTTSGRSPATAASGRSTRCCSSPSSTTTSPTAGT